MLSGERDAEEQFFDFWELALDGPPTRQEAEKIMFPVMCAEITKSLGEDEWRPSLSRLEVRELLD